jgi:alkylation response protein AidB-like acyl-CoA dehydrogenase
MDFDDTAEEAAFRAEVRSFLDGNAERKGPRAVEFEKQAESEKLAKARLWQAKKAEAGFAGITWPKSVGGRGAKPIHEVIYRQEEKNYRVPRGIYEVGLGVCMPIMLAYAREGDLARYVPPALSGKEIWCQLFSEPVAGSDLGGLRTRARRQGEDWVIDGQKIWTSMATFSDFGLIITRTDSTVPKHAGLTAFFLDMRSKGIEIRPVKQMSGGANTSFNEVFLTDVRVNDSQRLGAPGEGWKVSVTALMHERYGVADSPAILPGVEELHSLVSALSDAQRTPLIRSSAVREKLADLYVRTQGLKYTEYRTITALSHGRAPGPESSITKLVHGSMALEISQLAIDYLGVSGLIMDTGIAPMNSWFQNAFLASPTGRIAGGTDEILRNIIGERILGLPADARMDKDLPFNQIKTGGR